eukprot:m.202524 g.202524  ORF g.202524 m.202524 type:complete len:90 (-) comp18834_c1_seq1:30-299(-)
MTHSHQELHTDRQHEFTDTCTHFGVSHTHGGNRSSHCTSNTNGNDVSTILPMLKSVRFNGDCQPYTGAHLLSTATPSLASTNVFRMGIS